MTNYFVLNKFLNRQNAFDLEQSTDRNFLLESVKYMNVLQIFLTVHLHKMCIHICVVGCLHTFLCACVCMYVYVCLIVSVCEYLFTCIFICLCIDENQLRTKRKQDLKCISTRTWLYQLKGMSWVSALKKQWFDGTTHDYKYSWKYLLYIPMKNTPDKWPFTSTMNAKL